MQIQKRVPRSGHVKAPRGFTGILLREEARRAEHATKIPKKQTLHRPAGRARNCIGQAAIMRPAEVENDETENINPTPPQDGQLANGLRSCQAGSEISDASRAGRSTWGNPAASSSSRFLKRRPSEVCLEPSASQASIRCTGA